MREKLVWLMNRLSVMRGEDGRKATTVKVTVRVQGQASLLISSGRSLDSVGFLLDFVWSNISSNV